MTYRLTVFISLLLILVSAFTVLGAPEFTAQSLETSVLNPNDSGITVQEVLVNEFNQSIRIKELTVANFGNATENEIGELRVQYKSSEGDWSSVHLGNLTGINSGITFSLPGEGVTLHPGDSSRFQFKVFVGPPGNIPVSKYGQSLTLKLGAMFHYVSLNARGIAVDSVSSSWLMDPHPDTILRGGFESVGFGMVEEAFLHPGTVSTIGKFIFTDDDLNPSGVEVNSITVTNDLKTDDPLVLGKDIIQISLHVKIFDGDTAEERSITKSVNSPVSKVTFDLTSEEWWDGVCKDDNQVVITVKGKVAPGQECRSKHKLRTGLKLTTKEMNGMTGYPFPQKAITPRTNIQTLEMYGLEQIEDKTIWLSKVVNFEETFQQTLALKDDDANSDDFILSEIKLMSKGSLSNSDFKDISVYSVKEDGKLVKIGSGLTFGDNWQNLTSQSESVVPDQGELLIEVHYTVSAGATRGGTFSPLVQVKGNEGLGKNVSSPVCSCPMTLTVYPRCAELISGSRQMAGKPPTVDSNKLFAQRIDIMDKDENQYDLYINPIVIKNLGTATGADFEKLELHDEDGKLLVSTTNLNGLNTAGATLSNLDGITTVCDSQFGNWRSFYVYLTPSRSLMTADVRTVCLEATVYQSEGKRDHTDVVKGTWFEIDPRKLF